MSTEFNASISVTELLMKTLENCAKDLAQRCIREASQRHGFDADEEIRILGLENLSIIRKQMVKKPAETKRDKDKDTIPKKSEKQSFPMPFIKETVNPNGCQGLAYNRGLFTQCLKTRMENGLYCKGCQSEADNNASGCPDCGTVEQRLAAELYEFKDSNGRSPVSYVKVLNKLKLSTEAALEESGKLNIIIPNEHFVDEKVKKSSISRGRPKKIGGVIEVDNVTDLFAKLSCDSFTDDLSDDDKSSDKSSKTKLTDEEKTIKKAQLEEERARKKAEREAKITAERAEKADKEAKRLQDIADKEAKRLQDIADKEAKRLQEKADKEAEKEAKRLQEKAEKESQLEEEKAKKKAEKEAKRLQEKEEREAKIASEKAEKEAKRLQEKEEREAKIAAEKAEKEAEKEAKRLQEKEEREAKIAAEKAEKEAKRLQEKNEKNVKNVKNKSSSSSSNKSEQKQDTNSEEKKVESSSEPPPKVTVSRIQIGGKLYLKSNVNILYEPDSKEEVGLWDPETKTIKELPEDDEEEEEEEYDTDNE